MRLCIIYWQVGQKLACNLHAVFGVICSISKVNQPAKANASFNYASSLPKHNIVAHHGPLDNNARKFVILVILRNQWVAHSIQSPCSTKALIANPDARVRTSYTCPFCMKGSSNDMHNSIEYECVGVHLHVSKHQMSFIYKHYLDKMKCNHTLWARKYFPQGT